jgi:hypothetical protein
MPNMVKNDRSLWAQSVASDWRTISINIRMGHGGLYRGRAQSHCRPLFDTRNDRNRFRQKERFFDRIRRMRPFHG